MGYTNSGEGMGAKVDKVQRFEKIAYRGNGTGYIFFCF